MYLWFTSHALKLQILVFIFLYSVNLFFFNCRKIVELEEELRVVGNNLKSLEVSEEKVRLFAFLMNNN